MKWLALSVAACAVGLVAGCQSETTEVSAEVSKAPPVNAQYAVPKSVKTLDAYAESGPDTSILAIVDKCVTEQSRRGQAASVCVGLIRQGCPEPITTTVQMTLCQQAEAGYWTERMTQAQERLLERLQLEDREMADDGVIRVELALIAGDVQAQWETYRDARCGYDHARFRGGSLGRVSHLACRAEMAAHRALDIERMLDHHAEN
jgi:uncharacterized protein YecT (DUF1311 family)